MSKGRQNYFATLSGPFGVKEKIKEERKNPRNKYNKKRRK